MSKGLGQKITLRFSEKLVGDVSGLTPVPVGIGDYFKPSGTTEQSSASSTSYYFNKCFDDNITTHWYTTVAGEQWGQLQLSLPTFISGFRWYIGASHRPNAFILQGSNDGALWSTIYTGASPNVTGWHEFKFPTPTTAYSYYRWTITSRHSSYIYIYEIELLAAAGNEKAFTIHGPQYQYVNGPLINAEYAVSSVELHPDYTDDKHLLLTLHPQSRFNNVEGDITVTYDATKGNLSGRGGFIDDFTQDFSATDLVPFPNPHAAETININARCYVNLTEIEYKYRYEAEQIAVASSCTITLTYVGVINP